MYINFWYPVARSEEITAEKPLRVQILSLPFVAFRDDAGKARVLADTCVHRGGSLSAGLVKAGCVVGPYHGWQFNGDGKCVKVPSLGAEDKIPARAKVDSYPVQERYGIVFAFLGDLPEHRGAPCGNTHTNTSGQVARACHPPPPQTFALPIFSFRKK